AEADAAYMAGRRAAIADALGRFRPDVLVTETFPLGRRMLADEFEAAIAEVRRRTPSAAVIASVRDIPEPPRKPGRLAEAAARLVRDYDLLMVHGDPALVPLSAIWPLEAFAGRTRHTGYVAAPAPGGHVASAPGILVSVGGGVLGRRLLALAAEAAAGSLRRWHLLAGGSDAAEVAAGLRVGAPGNLVVEPARADYRALLSGAAASVSLAGYNTVLDLAACDTPAVLVPFEEKGEKEQGIRARALAGFPGIRVVPAEGLDAASLRRIAEAAAEGPRRPPLTLCRDGAERSARLITETVHAPVRQT
ncbi:MAG TPA: glycosyltransferase, partial [Thermohalobaculum sp.]|nr:glycosyltransferase [Thermohalobaculum sp.]